MSAEIPILPYSRVVGQEQLKEALELAWLSPEIGGVLVSGERGTAKSTTVRAFAKMVSGRLPVTLPINATDDRVIGGWQIDQLMRSEPVWQDGLIVEADNGMLYVDEVNLLDDHVVNLILDVASTGVLPVQRDGRSETVHVKFSLVGTMNPEEGGLRPQLLDRFGLIVIVRTEHRPKQRRDILESVLAFDDARNGRAQHWLDEALADDARRFLELRNAKEHVSSTGISGEIKQLCADIADRFRVAGHRGDYVMALAARARAALGERESVEPRDVVAVAQLALAHRLPASIDGEASEWSTDCDEAVAGLADA